MNPVVTVIVWFAAAVVTLDAAWRIVRRVLRLTVGRRRAAHARLGGLAANTQLSFFVSVLGQPALRRARKLAGASVAYVFVDDLFYVQALTDEDDQVLTYSVTTRSAKFKPVVPFPGGGRYSADATTPVAAKLCETSFAMMSATAPDNIWSSLGARRFGYVETYYWGNPSGYQSVAVGVNDAGPASEVVPVVEGRADFHSERNAEGTHETPAVVAEFRDTATPNTYTISAPNVRLRGLAPLSGAFGADLDEVRVFAS